MSFVKTSRKVHSTKYAQKKRTRRVIFIFLSALCLVTLVASVVLIMRSSFFDIDTVVVRGTSTLSPDLLREKTLSMVAHSSEAIRENLLNDFKEISTLSIKRSGFKTLTLRVEERSPAAVICLGFHEENTSTTTDCYMSDAHGYIFAPASSLTADSHTRYYVPTDTEDSPLGTTFMTETLLDELERFVSGSRQGGLSPLGILVGENGEYEMYIKNQTGNSEATVYFDDKAPFDTTLSNLLTFWENAQMKNKLNRSKVTATSTQAFDYINLRFGTTVYYSTQ